MSKLFKNIVFGKLYCGIEHSIVEGKHSLNYLLLKKQKQEFSLEKEGSSANITEFKKLLKKEQPVFVIINNEHVITKTLPNKIEPQKAVQSAFPNLDINDFYYEVHSTKENIFVSICRREYADGLISEYEAVSIHVIDFSLGSLISTQILPYIEDAKICTSNSQLIIKNKEITEIIKTDAPTNETYFINDLEIKGASINCLSGILCYYTEISKTKGSFAVLKNKLRADFIQKQLFNLGLRAALGIIFIVLLSNFLIFSNYRDKINILNIEIEIGENNKVKLFALKNEVDKKEKIINEISMVEGSKLSMYFDIIGATIPKTMQLDKLSYQPLTKKIKNKKQIIYSKEVIIIKGVTLKSNDFSNWITVLEKEKWIKSILVLSYGIGKQKSSEFEIKITMNH